MRLCTVITVLSLLAGPAWAFRLRYPLDIGRMLLAKGGNANSDGTTNPSPSTTNPTTNPSTTTPSGQGPSKNGSDAGNNGNGIGFGYGNNKNTTVETCVDALATTNTTSRRSLLASKTCKDLKGQCGKVFVNNGVSGRVGQKWCRKTCGACGSMCTDRLPTVTVLGNGKKSTSCKDLSCDDAFRYGGVLGSVGDYWCQQTCGTCPEASGPTDNIGSMYTPALKVGFCLDNCTNVNDTCGMVSCLMPNKPTWAQVEVAGANRTYQLKNVLTGTCLGFRKADNLRHVGSTTTIFYAARVQCSGSDYATWVSPLVKQYSFGTFNLKYGSFATAGNTALPDMCLDVKQYNTNLGAPVIVYPCKTATTFSLSNQLWNFTL